jgi:hypothetical protein
MPSAVFFVVLVLTALGPADIERALTIGKDGDAARARFHAAYVASPETPDIERVEVVTEFRRVVLAQEEHIRRGDHMFSARQARAEIGSTQGKVTIGVRVRFHPQNVYVSVPAYEVAIGDPAIPPADVRRTPLYANVGPKPPKGQATPLIGGLVEADFDAGLIGSNARTVRVLLDRREVARVMVDFGRLD